MPLYADLLAVRAGCIAQAWDGEGKLAGGAQDFALPSLGWTRLRSGTLELTSGAESEKEIINLQTRLRVREN